MEQRGNPAGEESKSLQSALIKGCYFDKWDKNKKHKRLQQGAWNGRWALSFLSKDVFAIVSHAWLLEAIFSDSSLLLILLAVTVVWNVLNRVILCVWNAFKSLSAAFWFISQTFCIERMVQMVVTNGSVIWDSMPVQPCRRASKPDVEVTGSVQHMLTNVSWASFLFLRWIRGLLNIKFGIWLSSLYRISLCTMAYMLPHAIFYGPLEHGDGRSKPLKC